MRSVPPIMPERRSARPDGESGYDFETFGLSDMVEAAAALRGVAERASGFPAAAREVVGWLHGSFVDERGASVLPLVRLFTTRRFADLADDVRRVVTTTGAEPPSPDLRCLTLEATVGLEPEWNDPARSRAHRVIPLASTDALAGAPMISALVSELGLHPAEVVAGAIDARRRGFGVFHVPVATGSSRIPDQEFVDRYAISSVLGFGGVLPSGDVFCVVMFSRAPISAEAAELFRAISVSVRAGLLAHAWSGRGEVDLAAQRDALHEHLEVLEDTGRRQAAALENAVRRLRAEAELVDTLQVVGRRLTAQLDLDVLVQDATDAATKATGAEFGAFFYNLVDQFGESYTLYSISGVPREAFSRFPMPRNTAVFEPTFKGTGTMRSDDITLDPRYGRSAPHHGMPEGHLPVRSYLAVSVVSPSSQEVLGGFFFGHHETGRFTARHQQLAEGIAGYAAIALDNARLFARQRTMAMELARSMLPVVPRVSGLEIASRYLPAATGSEVGGDWFDVIELSAGRTAFVIGDVVGRGVTAAAVMGQIRTAVRSYALLDLPPVDVLHNVSALADTTPGATFITCFYAVFDPVDQTLTYAVAGHLPAILLLPDGTTALIGESMGMPLGVGDKFSQQQTLFPEGARLVLYTDGLVESRDRDLTTGIDHLVQGLRNLPGDVDAQVACDKLIDRLTGGRHDDDVALLHVHHTGGHRRVASLSLTADPGIARKARRFVAERLEEWELAHVSDAALIVTSELVANAVKHTDQPGLLRVHHDGARLTIDVSDHHGAVPRLFEAGPEEEQHRGLFLVNAFAARWGSRTTTDGKVVWAEITTRSNRARPQPPGRTS
ncbi:SpoIIE family protein phosphatase [Saccharothrix sp. S26]|uniref:ATP-binding SpoIIE family protein phosphatase n=1 Tax=Saccharothrix sp. S26 TaxID=2907215 RepID=UPI001F3E5240|nr:SpoIIE family protein phosphatase [Saccharothrix sp. S26]MCE6995383.1 SpoIIE family protein phosphatase [Saccharothrix sp. S26]